MKIVIPSLGRSESINTKDGAIPFVGFKGVKVYVKPQEVEDYEKVIPKEMIFEVPEDKIGLGAIRNFLVDEHKDEDYFVIMDDDITGLTYRFADKMEEVVDGDHFREVIRSTMQMALDIGTPLFAYGASQNPNHYTQLDHFDFKGNIASIHGIIPELLGSINYDPRLIVMNDYDIALQCKYYKRYVLIDKRYNLTTSDKWFNKGGSSTLRNKDLLEKCSKILLAKYGSKVIKYNPKKIQYNLSFLF